MITSQIEIEDITGLSPTTQRILMTDPKPLYEAIYNRSEQMKPNSDARFSHFKRHNSLDVHTIFPNQDDKSCACGCGQELSGRRRRYATDECNIYVRMVYGIIAGQAPIITKIMKDIFGMTCNKCGIDENQAHEKYCIPTASGIVNCQIELDHIVPVHQGGGGCWLSNYQFLCKECHKQKSREERKRP